MQLTQIHIPAERCIVSGSITMLNLDANCFSEVPSCMAQFTSLQASLPPLECRSVFLRAVKRNHRDCCTGAQREEESADCPSRVSELHQVITGSLWVVAFCVHLCLLRPLQVLNASGNSLEQVPVPICTLPRLRTLDLSNNNIRFLPPQVADSSTLTSLSLHANDLRQLPSSLASMARCVGAGFLCSHS
jgi:Leucine-rich repeat (LRR) protein